MTGEKKFIVGIFAATIALVVVGVIFLSRGTSAPQVSPSGTVDQAKLVEGATHTIGNKDAPATIVEFADFQCPACKAAEPILKTVLENNKDKVYFVYRHFPLPAHANARTAASAAEAAGVQGKFWEMHDRIYATQTEWEKAFDAKDKFESFAKDLGLDVEKYKQDRDKFGNQISADFALGSGVGVDSTPTFFINGQKFPGVQTPDQFQKLIDDAVAKKNAGS